MRIWDEILPVLLVRVQIKILTLILLYYLGYNRIHKVMEIIIFQ